MTAFAWDDASEFFDADWQVSVTISGTAYNAIPYSKENMRGVINAGLSDEIKMSFMFKVSDFTSLPLPDTLLTYATVEYRIKRVRPDSTNKTFTVDVTEKYGS